MTTPTKTFKVRTDRAYYGCLAQLYQPMSLAEDIADAVENEFHISTTIDERVNGIVKGHMGLDDEEIDDINAWIERNWIEILDLHRLM